MNKKEKRLYYLEYTLLFSLIAGVAVFYFYSNGKTMISEGGDGFRQHYRALLYYSNYLKQIVHNFLHGVFEIPQWDFAIGEGADALLTLHLHAIGDVFAFFSVFCPERYMYLYYDGMSLVRMYCSGLFFSMLCFYMGKRKRYAVLSGALLYAFCAFSLTSMYNHAYFIAASVYLPLIILGAEKVIRNDKPYLLIFAVMFSALSNFYFFFMNVVSTVLYVGIRLLFSGENIRNRIESLIRVFIYSLTGVLLSCIVFLPMLNVMLNNSRMNAPVQYDSLFPLPTYLAYFTKMSFHGSYFGGFSHLWILAFSYLFFKSRKPVLIALLVTAFLFTGIPFLSSIYHAFTYPTDRWLYAVSLIVAYISVEALEDLKGINDLFAVNAVLSVLYYGACVMLDPDSRMIHMAFFAYTAAVLIAIKLFKEKKLTDRIVTASLVLFFIIQMFYIFGPNYWNYVRQGTSIDKIPEMTAVETVVFDQIEDDSFFRYSGYKLSENGNIHGDRSSTQHYWSIVNNDIVSFRTQLGYSDSSLHHINGYGERFSQNALSGVKYYINTQDDYVPYGFEYLKTVGPYKVYQSGYALPLVYAYDGFLSREEWDRLDPVQKNEALVQAAFLEEDADLIDKREIRLEETEVPYVLSAGKDITVSEDQIRVTGKDAFIHLDARQDMAGEYYAVIQGLYSDVVTAYVRVSYKDIEKAFVFKGTDNQHYTDRHDYIVNLGYLEGLDGRVSFDFSDGGEFTYGSIRLVCQPLEGQIRCLQERKNIGIDRLEVGNDKIETELTLANDRLVCFAIPYSKGWKAYIDGTKAKIFKCNVEYMALQVPSGTHQIVLKYSTPMMLPGSLLSLSGIFLTAGFLIRDKRTRHKKAEESI